MRFPHRTWPVAIALAIGLAACPTSESPVDDDDATDPADPPPPPVLEVEGNVDADPHRLDFGQVEATSTGTLDLRLANTGGRDLLLTPPGFTGDAGFELADGAAWPAVMAPGDVRELGIDWTPTADGEVAGWLGFGSNDPALPAVQVVLTGDGIGPRLVTSPIEVEFGQVPLFCAPSTLPLHVINAGRAPLTLLGVDLDVFADPAEIQLEGALPAEVIEPGGSVALALSFAPTVQGPQTGLLTLSSDDPSDPAHGVAVQGQGVWPPLQVDTWVAGTPLPVDILWVVDNSSSVGDEQATFAYNLAAWFDEQLGSGLVPDWQLAVVTTDVSDSGAFVSQWGQPVLTPAVPDAGYQFSGNANLGMGGSGIEQGFHNAWQALEPAGPNPSFLRAPAALSIIFLSDEAEQSGSIQGWEPEEYVAAFQGLKADPSWVILSAISGGASGCNGAGGWASAGADYVLAASMTGGLSVSICDANWSAAFADPAWRPEGLVGWFPLSLAPVPASVEVTIEGVPLASSAWQWEEPGNVIVIEPGVWPEEGELVEITYVAADSCAP